MIVKRLRGLQNLSQDGAIKKRFFAIPLVETRNRAFYAANLVQYAAEIFDACEANDFVGAVLNTNEFWDLERVGDIDQVCKGFVKHRLQQVAEDDIFQQDLSR